MHSVGAVIMMPGIIDDFANGHYLRGALYTGINILVNLYPIMLQRTNRKIMTDLVKELDNKDA